jgi:uracil-DNA glycosylase family 4
VIVGLAPGAHGANRTGRLFTGDSSGDWLYRALHRVGFANQANSVARDDGLALRDCWITATARCAPPANRPLPGEIERCRPFLAGELALLPNARVVLVLGRIAHDGFLRAAGLWDRPASGKRPAFSHGARWPLPDGRILLCSYHPSRQNTNTGRLTRSMWNRIFTTARRLVERG